MSGAGISVGEIMKKQKAEGPATILAIGTATPPNCFPQAEYPDYYFRVTNSEHQTQLKEEFKLICEKTMIKTRYFHLTEEMIAENPNMKTYNAPSLDTRQKMLIMEVPKLGAKAATKAINEWGHSVSKITHLIFCCTLSAYVMPGADYQLTKLLSLNPDVKRYMIYLQGSLSGGTALRLAKDLAENNAEARVLIVCAEITASTFQGPNLESMVAQALLGDGSSAVIVGSDPDPNTEHPLYQIVSTTQTIIVPNSEEALTGTLSESGLIIRVKPITPQLISSNTVKVVKEVFRPIGISNWNSLFWVAQPSERVILDQIETELGLEEEKMWASKKVLSQYGNMVSASVFFVLDEMLKKSVKDGMTTTGEGLDWGVLLGFGPGLTVETVVLHSMPA